MLIVSVVVFAAVALVLFKHLRNRGEPGAH